MNADDERRYVYAVARRIVRDDATASDVTQDALLLAFRHREQFRGAASYRTRRVIELRFRDGYGEDETARALGLTTAAVKVRAFRARRMLRARLAPHGP